MSTLKHGAYTAAIATALTSQLDSLADAGKTLTAEIDNTSDLNLYDDLVLNVLFPSAPVNGTPVEVFIIPAIDGTNYSDGGAAVEPAQANFVGAFNSRNVNTAQVLSLLNIPIPPSKFKYLIRNSTGQAMTSSSNTFQRRTHNLQVV